MDPLRVRVELLRTARETGGELLEFDVIGRARGLLAQSHVHPWQVERLEVMSGAMRLRIDGHERLLTEGQSMEVPAGAPHRQLPEGRGPGRARVQVRPAGRTQAFLERLTALCRDGQINRFGLPRPVAGAHLVRDLADTGHAAGHRSPFSARSPRWSLLSPGRCAPTSSSTSGRLRLRPRPSSTPSPTPAATRRWWRPVYLEVESDGPPVLGKESRQRFKGRLPYHLHTRSVIVALDPPRTITAEVDGDLRGRGTWTLTPTPAAPTCASTGE
jgi:quercetin dioxygenase-like cupin family protein